MPDVSNFADGGAAWSSVGGWQVESPLQLTVPAVRVDPGSNDFNDRATSADYPILGDRRLAYIGGQWFIQYANGLSVPTYNYQAAGGPVGLFGNSFPVIGPDGTKSGYAAPDINANNALKKKKPAAATTWLKRLFK